MEFLGRMMIAMGSVLMTHKLAVFLNCVNYFWLVIAGLIIVIIASLYQVFID